MIYANSVSLIDNAQCHTLLTPAGQRELKPAGSGGNIPCPGCEGPTRVVLVEDFEAFHVCGNAACALCLPDAALREVLAGMAFTPVIRHGC